METKKASVNLILHRSLWGISLQDKDGLQGTPWACQRRVFGVVPPEVDIEHFAGIDRTQREGKNGFGGDLFGQSGSILCLIVSNEINRTSIHSAGAGIPLFFGLVLLQCAGKTSFKADAERKSAGISFF